MWRTSIFVGRFAPGTLPPAIHLDESRLWQSKTTQVMFHRYCYVYQISNHLKPFHFQPAQLQPSSSPTQITLVTGMSESTMRTKEGVLCSAQVDLA